MSPSSQSAAIARLSVSRTRSSPPTLPPRASTASAIFLIVPFADDRDADVLEGGGDRGVRLVDGDADGCDLLETAEHRLGDGAGRGLDQAITFGPERLARHIDH